MNMKKIKKFFTLSRRAEGFTLVELIVVIAILAILGGVAVPAYSGYVKKAHMAADYTLVSDVSKALQLQYYSNPNNGVAAYVILGTDGSYTIGEEGPATLSAEATPANPDAAAADFANKAMIAVFGEGWKNTVKLEYGEWSDNGMMDYVMDNTKNAALIADSSFLTVATPDALMGAVTNLTDAASKVIQNFAADGGDVVGKLSVLCGPEFVENLEKTGVKEGSDEYETVISNMLVGHFSEKMNENESSAVKADQLCGMALTYAELFAYCEYSKDPTTMNNLNTYLSGASDMDMLSTEGLVTYLNTPGVAPEGFMDNFLKYTGNTDDPNSRGSKDVEAALEILGAVSFVSGTYTDKASLSDPQLYASASVGEQLNNYINAIRAVANLSETAAAALSGLPAGAVAVFIDAYGNVSAVPGTVYLAG